MAKSGQVIYNKVSTDKIVFTQTRAETQGQLLQFENYHQPNGVGPAPHRHPLQEETFTVHKGTLSITIEGNTHILTAGQQIVVPPDSVHFWQNSGDTELYMTTEFRPALHFEEIIETIASLSQMGKMDERGNPNPMQMSATLNAYYGEFFLDTMPLGVQKFLFGVLGRLLRWVGFKDYIAFDGLNEKFVP
ncbi:MAG: cupin domain-containing protein [Spirosomataceae bacterium]